MFTKLTRRRQCNILLLLVEVLAAAALLAAVEPVDLGLQAVLQ
jgi:hypothetical protein